MNGKICCVLGVCCAAGSQRQFEALAEELVKDGIVSDADDAMKAAQWILKHFDLAPAGSVTALKSAIAALARHQLT